ncbi:hypothetical protein EK21DRAFT_91987 [Setomelanomma holmii]|uniref:Uncharacterized protein n=1 Tax=Setomelanomma holmii TaxID=210430 RepID=A0A9P4H414_9PLEO|nr:hypothetical protein EK21DRAFT_91987 [Setomelanomma holmii]
MGGVLDSPEPQDSTTSPPWVPPPTTPEELHDDGVLEKLNFRLKLTPTSIVVPNTALMYETKIAEVLRDHDIPFSAIGLAFLSSEFSTLAITPVTQYLPTPPIEALSIILVEGRIIDIAFEPVPFELMPDPKQQGYFTLIHSPARMNSIDDRVLLRGERTSDSRKVVVQYNRRQACSNNILASAERFLLSPAVAVSSQITTHKMTMAMVVTIKKELLLADEHSPPKRVHA